MNELTEILSNSQPIPIRKLCKLLFDQHTILELNKSSSSLFCSIIFSALSNPKLESTDKDLYQLKLILTIFIIAFKPPPKIIDFEFPSETNNGYIFASSLVVQAMQSNDKDNIQFFNDMIKKHINFLFVKPKSTGKQKKNFFSLTRCYYFQIIPIIMGNHILSGQFIQNISDILYQICQLEQEDLTLSTINFISEIYKSIKNCLMVNIKSALPNNFLDSVITIVNLTQQYPSICLSVFFHTWFFLVKQCINTHPTQPLLCLVPTITKCFEKVASYKYHELHRSFPWYLCYWFYDFLKKEDHSQKVQVLSLICNGVRTEPRMNSIHRQSCENSVKMFATSIVSQCFENQPYYLYYVLTSLNSSFEMMIYKLQKIHSFGQIVTQFKTPFKKDQNNEENANEQSSTKPVNYNEELKLFKRQINFYEQSNYSPFCPIFDHYMFSYSYEKDYESEEECIDDFEQMCRICEIIRKYIQSIEIIFEQIILNLKRFLNQEIEANPNFTFPVPFYYMFSIFSTLINFMIHATHKQMEIQSFLNKEAFDISKISSQYISTISNPRKILDFTHIYQAYFKLFEDIPPFFHHSLVNVIINAILKNLKKGTLTISLIETLSCIYKDKMNDPHSMFYTILNRLIEAASTKTSYLLSKDASDVNSFYFLIFFTIRLATFNGRNPYFGITLQLYQKLFITSVMANTKFIFHQAIGMRLICHYLAAVNDNIDADQKYSNVKTSENTKAFRYKPANIEEFELNARLDAFNAVLDISLEEPEYMSIMSLIPILDASFSSNESKLIEKAARICLRVFKYEDPERWTGDSEIVKRLFKQFFESSKTINNLELSSEILELLPKFAPAFLNNHPLLGNEQKVRFQLKDVNIDLLEVLKAVSAHMDYSDEEIKHIFALISVGFEVVLDSIVLQEMAISQTLLQLIILLKYCFGFKCLENSLKNLTSYITKSFGDLFLRGESDLYIICVFDAMGMNRLESTITIMNLAVSFFEYCKGKPINPSFVSKTADKLFFFFPLSTRLFSILGGFSLIIRYYPEFILLNQLRSFLIQTTEINPIDNGFHKILNNFLKEFLKKNDIQTQKDFVALVYEIICPLSIGVRRILEKRVSKLGIPIHIHSLDELFNTTHDNILLFQKLTLAFLCGIEGDILNNMNIDIVNRVSRFMNPSNLDGIHRFEKFARILSLLKSILNSSNIFYFFISKNPDFLSLIVKFLCQALLSHYSPIQQEAKKCFILLINRYPDEIKNVNQISDFWKNYTKFSFNNNLNRIVFCTQLTKIFPDKPSEDIIRFLMNEISVYVEKTDIDKMNSAAIFVRILEQLAVKKFINQEKIKFFILNVNNEEGISYFEFYLKNILNLYRCKMIPFRGLFVKPVMKFLSFFPSQTINYLINVVSENSLCNFHFLEYLIVYDMKDIFFHSFLDIFKVEHDFTSFSPVVYQLFQKLTSEHRFVNDKDFLIILKREFALVIRSINDHSRYYENEYELLSILTDSILNVYKENLELRHAIALASIFNFSFFAHSSIYKKYISIIFQPSRIQNVQLMFQQILSQLYKIKPLILSILLPHCLKTLPTITQDEAAVIFNARLLTSSDPTLVTIGLRCSRILISKMIPEKKFLFDLCNDLMDCFDSSDVETIVYSLKLSVKLVEKNYLSPVLFESIVKQIFSFPKFFELPYLVHSTALLKARPDLIENLSPSVIETISFFFYDKFISFREMQKSIPIILSLSKIFKLLPFSLFTSITSIFDSKVTGITDVIPPDVVEIIFFCIRLYMNWEPNEKEKEYFFEVGFKFIRVLLSQKQISNLSKFSYFVDNFFNFLVENKTFNVFPEDLLENIEEIEDNLCFNIVCTASHFVADILYEKYSLLVEKSLFFVLKEKVPEDETTIQIPLFIDLLQFIFSKKEIFCHFSPSVYSLVGTFLQNYSEEINEYLFSTVKALIYHHYDYEFMNIINKMMNLQEQLFKMPNKKLYSLLFQMILKLLEIMPIENQMNYFLTIVEKNQWDLLSRNIFTKVVHSLIKCPAIHINVKKQILDSFPIILLGTANELEKIYCSINEFGIQNEIQISHYLIYLKIVIASYSSPSQRLILFDQIEKLLDINFKERLKFFIHNLPIVLWSNEYFIYIVALLTEKVKIWQPIFAFSSKLGNVSDLLAIVAFKRLLDEEISFELQQFLKQLLKEQKEIRNKYTKVITSILQTFFRSDYFLPYSLAYKASCVTGDFEFDHHFFRKNDVCQKRFVMPESRNHLYFGFYLPQLTRKQACAAALTLLYQYDIAEHFYQDDEPSDLNSYYGQIRLVNQHLIEPQFLTFSEIIRPLVEIDRKVNSTVILLEKAVNSFFNKQCMPVSQYIKDIKQIIFQDFRSHRFSSIYQNERAIVIEVLCDKLLKLLETGEDGNDSEIMKKHSCLNPSFLELINDFSSFLKHEKSIPEELTIDENKEPPCIIISNINYYFNIKKVTGITSHGLYALSPHQINQQLEIMANKITNNIMATSDWVAYAPFCFNIFTIVQTLDFFSTAYYAYYRIFTSKEDIHSIMRKDASARIVTLIRIAEQNEKKNFMKPILETASIFQQSYAEIWRFWLQQLVELARKKWFRDISMNLFCEMTYRSTLYSKKSSSKELQDILRTEIASRNSFIQISMMEKIERIVSRIYEINVEEFEYQKSITNFIEESFKLTNEELSNIHLMKERRKSLIITPFGNALSHLMKDDIDKIGNFKEWVSNLRQMNQSDLELFVKNFTNSTETFSNLRQNIDEAIDNFNDQLPFIFPIHLDYAPQLAVFRFNKDISYLLPDLIVCRATTSINSRNTFLIQKSHDQSGLHASVITLATCFSIFRVILQSSYPSRMRAINLAVSFCFEIGERTLLMQLMSYPISLKDLFEKVMMIRQKDWVLKYTDKKTGKITKEGLENVKTFPTDSLEKFHEKTMPEKTFLGLRRGLAESYAAAVIIRHMLSAPYQDMGRIIACTKAAEIPVLLTDFDYGDSFLNEAVHSTFRLCPTMQVALGPQVIGELFLSMASVAHAFTSHLESIRTYIELIVCDEMVINDKVEFDIVQEMIRRRTIVENRFISLSPPKPKTENIDECLGWYDNLMKIIEKSRNPFAQPVYTIPWF
ncbi:hypothetical protein M9Y10_033426 [Tritrichomonas musculus]|uniref:Uncharacterized protein n=1 Tax=Tritrichomonas musculus TaxID=1915356 RepID=A0ABR2KE23_9EUKA